MSNPDIQSEVPLENTVLRIVDDSLQPEDACLELLRRASAYFPLSDNELALIQHRGDQVELHLGATLLFFCASEIVPFQAYDESKRLSKEIKVISAAYAKPRQPATVKKQARERLLPLQKRSEIIAESVLRYTIVVKQVENYAEQFTSERLIRDLSPGDAIDELIEKTDSNHPVIKHIMAIRMSRNERLRTPSTIAERSLRQMMLQAFGSTGNSKVR